MKIRYILLFVCVLLGACKHTPSSSATNSQNNNAPTSIASSTLPIKTFHRNLPPFKNIIVNGSITLSIVLGKPFTMTIKANDKTEQRLQLDINKQTLTISRNTYTDKRYSKSPVTITISTPTLSALSLGDNTLTTISHLEAKTFVLAVSDNASLNFQGKVEWLKCRTNDNATLHLAGRVNTLSLRATDRSKVDARSLNVTNAKIISSDKAHITLHVNHTLAAILSDQSQITYRGKPKHIDITTLGAATVTAKT